MTASDILDWFESLHQELSSLPPFGKQLEAPWHFWLIKAQSALEAAFPPNHPCRRAWENAERGLINLSPLDQLNRVGLLWATFQSARQILREGRLGSLIDAARAETEWELLDQANKLLEDGYLAAATVIAGGALETHLRHLVSRYGLTIEGSGSIGEYGGTICKARKDKKKKIAVSATECKYITAWGGLRNDAAHRPLEFPSDAKQVDIMIQGIRNFIARTT